MPFLYAFREFLLIFKAAGDNRIQDKFSFNYKMSISCFNVSI